MNLISHFVRSGLCALSLLGCGSGEVGIAGSSRPSNNVTQGGAQDISAFRAVVAANQIPALELLDPVGFFAEHALDLPSAKCGQSVCLHPMLAVAPRFDGGNWTMAFVAMNTGVDAVDLSSQPRHLVLVIEHTIRTYRELENFGSIGAALRDNLGEQDRVSVLLTEDPPKLLLYAAPPRELQAVLLPAINPSTPPATKVDLYGALGRASELLQGEELSTFSQRILLFSSGQTDVGVNGVDRYLALGETIAGLGVGITTFGMGPSYRRETLAALADVGSGNYYFATSPADLLDAVQVESKTAFVPLARDFTISIDAAPGYRVGRVYAARRAVATEQRAILSTPTLFIGARQGSELPDTGRRGGGGGWFVELFADHAPGEILAEAALAFTLRAQYQDALTGASVEFETARETPLGIGQNPPADAPFFSDPARAKPFMMLNMYLALHTQLSLFEQGQCGEALGVAEMMNQSYEYFRSHYDDADIDADHALLMDLTRVIDPRCSHEIVQPVSVPMGCFMF